MRDLGDTGTVVITLTSAVAGDQVITMTPYTSTGGVGTPVTKTLKWVTALTAEHLRKLHLPT
jgi:hypothetical protein